MRWNLVGNYLAYLLVRVLIAVLQALPIETCQRLTRPLVWLVADVFHVRQRVLDENLSHAFPGLSEEGRRQLIRRNWEHLLLMVIEIAHAPRKIHETNWRRYIRLRDGRCLVGNMLSERPAVIVCGHFGNFEVAGQVVGLLGLPTFTVARPLDNPFLHDLVEESRTRNGQVILPKKGSSPEVEQLLSTGGTLTVLGDQSAGLKGCWVDFFGRKASTNKAIAVFSLTYEAPLMVSYARRLDKPLHIEIGLAGDMDPRDADAPAGGISEVTAWFTDRLEEAVRRDPEQYWWVHRRWKDYGGVRTRRKKAA